MHSNQSFNVMCEYMATWLQIFAYNVGTNSKKKNIYLNSIMTSSKSKLSENIETWQMWSPRWQFRKIQRGFPWTALILILNFVVGEWPVVFLVDGNGDSLLKLQMAIALKIMYIKRSCEWRANIFNQSHPPRQK
jgi:hypothetical protein